MQIDYLLVSWFVGVVALAYGAFQKSSAAVWLGIVVLIVPLLAIFAMVHSLSQAGILRIGVDTTPVPLTLHDFIVPGIILIVGILSRHSIVTATGLAFGVMTIALASIGAPNDMAYMR